LVTKDALGNSLDEGTIPGKNIIAGSLTGLTVTAGQTVVSESTVYTFGYTCEHIVPVSGYIRIGFDSSYFLDNSIIQTAGYIIAEKGDDYLLLRTTQQREGANSIIIGGIRFSPF